MPLYLTPSTWRTLGLSVAASYTALGLFEVLLPHRAASEFLGLPSPSSTSTSTSATAQLEEAKGQSYAVSLLVPLLGVRDIAVAAALWTFAYQGKWKEMGTVILAGTILCAADCLVVWRQMGAGLSMLITLPRSGAQFTGGAVSWTVIGAVLFWEF
ncbi:hypothetical protein OQA88_5810 [Cercophora sp. LCS_1]